MPEEISFGVWLRHRRRMLDLTQQALAKQVGCARITLRRIEADALKPSKELANILLEKLGIPELERPSWILFARGLASFPTPTVDPLASQSLTNLPASLTTFIGREKEQAEIIKHIRKYRLVTLTGPGGVGKTRLSIKVGEQMLGDYVNGVWLMELASLTDPALLPQTVMSLFGIAAQTKTAPTEILINFLRAKTTLLILDNCEHILESCAQLADALLKNCPNLKILATSRESLGITGEATYRVPSLGVPDVQQLLETFRGYESVRLFEERAQLAKLDFSLTLENAASVAQICHRLDGIPLAIELAAAHVNMFSTEQLATKLNESFNILTGGSRTALPRQQTIRASIEWSWNLLSDSECSLLRRLAVFAGGWILESAESVCATNEIEKDQVVDLMSQLVAKSLVVTNQESGRERRFHLLETIRQYADEKLVAAGEKENIRTQHLKYFLKLSEAIEPGLRSPLQIEWFARTNDELYNLRAALEWASKTDVEAGLNVASRLGFYWISFEYSEGARWLNEFLQNPQAKEHPNARAHALIIQGHILVDLEQFVPGRSTIEECLELYRASGNRQGEIDSLLFLGGIIVDVGKRTALIQQALDLARSIDDVWGQASALQQLGWDHRDHVFAYWQEAMALLRNAGDLRRLAAMLSRVANFVLLDGDFQYAQTLLDESIELNQHLKNKSLMGYILLTKGNMALLQGNYELARANFQQQVLIHNEIGQETDWAHSRLGYVALRESNLIEAHQIFEETVRNFHKRGNQIGLASTLEGIVSLNVLIGKPERAAHLIGWADATREQIGDARWKAEQADVDKDIQACIANMGDVAFSNAYEAGKKMSLDEAVNYALGDV